ncbi:hypothetical protein RIF29_41533 [Crotalaria pallida]|uniref:Uncharacterized protein n=1 Tax=Crotalaria pallida TaxID=3830 RepID=A0AAN9HVD9_CROPI
MDLDTENKLAAILMREAAELRRQSQKEGVLAYLCKPNVRNRPNSRFLSATVRGVQQANRAVEVNEMWRVRQKEVELDKRVKGTSSKDKSNGERSHRDGIRSRSPRRHDAAYNSTSASSSFSSKREYKVDERVEGTSKEKSRGDRSLRDDNSSRSPRRHAVVDNSTSDSHSYSSKREYEHSPEGLKDEELEEFLHSRRKRGRGAVGPRMDETGPYLPPHPCRDPSPSPDAREHRVIYGPERPPSLKSYESSEEELHEERRKKTKKSYESSEEELHEERRKKIKKSHASKSEKERSKKRRSKEKSKHKKKRDAVPLTNDL